MYIWKKASVLTTPYETLVTPSGGQDPQVGN